VRCVIMNRSLERPIDEQWAVIKRARKWGWRSSRLTANEFARQAVIACDSCTANGSMNYWVRGLFKIHPRWWKQLFLIYKVNTFSLLEYVLMLYITYL